MVLNAHDRLPEIGPDQRYMIWNYAPYEATYTLNGIAPGSAVYSDRRDGLVAGHAGGKLRQAPNGPVRSVRDEALPGRAAQFPRGSTRGPRCLAEPSAFRSV